MKKICNKCKIEKDLEEFNKSKLGKFGVNGQCRSCIAEYNKLRNEKNKENIKQYYLNNKEKINNSNKIYYENNKEEHSKRCKINRQNNPEINRKSTRKWIKNNPDYHKEYRRKRYNEDPSFRLRIVLGNRLNELFKKKKINKNNSIINLIGCSFIELKNFIESKFLPEMNWSNQGSVWEIDHIIPCSSFDLTKEEEQQKCFHFSNFQPLFKTTNIAENLGYFDKEGNRNKSDKIS